MCKTNKNKIKYPLVSCIVFNVEKQLPYLSALFIKILKLFKLYVQVKEP